MSIRYCSLVLLILWIWTAQAMAEGTPKIDRAIAKEPVYQTKQPEYWLLVFGPDATTRVWVVRDGDVLYVDRNGDGDLTGADERVPFKDGGLAQALPIAAGKTPFAITSLHTMEAGRYYVRVEAEGKRLQYASVKPASRREDAPVLHFDGPLVMGLAHTDPSQQPLRRSSKPYDFSVLVTTAGPAQKEAWGPVIDHQKYVPADVHPVAEFEFVPKKAGGETIKVKAVLNLRC